LLSDFGIKLDEQKLANRKRNTSYRPKAYITSVAATDATEAARLFQAFINLRRV